MARTASFCMQRSGHFDAWDQGMAFFLPNMTWLQPPGYVHQMISRTWADYGVQLDWAGGGGCRASAQRSADSQTLVVRFVNSNATAIDVTIAVTGMAVAHAVRVLTLAAADPAGVNTPSEPRRISPEARVATIPAAGPAVFTVPAHSFTVWSFTAESEVGDP